MSVKIEDDGFIDVHVGDAKVAVDLYAAHNRLLDLYRETEDAEAVARPAGAASPVPLNQRIADYMGELGFGRVSHRAATKFAEAMHAAVGDLRKNDGAPASPSTTAGSPSSTASPSTE